MIVSCAGVCTAGQSFIERECVVPTGVGVRPRVVRYIQHIGDEGRPLKDGQVRNDRRV